MRSIQTLAGKTIASVSLSQNKSDFLFTDTEGNVLLRVPVTEARDQDEELFLDVGPL